MQTEGGLVPFDAEQLVSMNMWMLTPAFADMLQGWVSAGHESTMPCRSIVQRRQGLCVLH